MDATHTKALYNQKTPKEILMDRSKKLRKAVYTIDETMKSKFPAKTTTNAWEDEIDYCQKLIDVIDKEGKLSEYPMVTEPLNLLKEAVTDDIEQLRISEDRDAKIGHKSEDSSFFGYKTHLAMSEERIITAATLTTGEKNDGKQLEILIEKSIKAGMDVKTVIGDAAYSEEGNIAYTQKKEMKLVAKLNTSVTQGFR